MQREQVDEARQLADGERTVAHTVGATDQQADVDDVRHTVEQRLERAAQTNRLDAGLTQPRGDHGQPFGLATLGTEGLHHVHAVEALVHRRTQLAELDLCGIEVGVDVALVEDVQAEHRREHQHRGQSEHRIGDDEPHRGEHQHHHDAAREGQRLQHGGRGFGVDASTGDQVAGALASVPRRRLGDHPVDHVAGELLGDAPPGATGPHPADHHADAAHDAHEDQRTEDEHHGAGAHRAFLEPGSDQLVGHPTDDLGRQHRARGEHRRTGDRGEEESLVPLQQLPQEVEGGAEGARPLGERSWAG